MVGSSHAARPPWRRGVIALAAGVLGAGGAYLASLAIAYASCETGACPVGGAPLPFVLLVGIVAAWAASVGAREA